MTLKDVRDYIASLKIAEDENCYCGKLPDKKEKSIGIYPLKNGHPLRIPLGGIENASYGTKAISLLVHWNKSPKETEQAAEALQKALLCCREVTINEKQVKFVMLSYEEPIPVGTDDNGVFEYVLECRFFYGKERKG